MLFGIAFDLDNDGNEELLLRSLRHYWRLWVEDDRWNAEKIPVKRIEQVVEGNLKIALSVIHNRRLFLLRKRGQWVWQRIAENVKDTVVTDLDGDAKEDDLVVLRLNSKCQVVWFEVDSEGHAHYRDAILLPKPSHSNIWLWDRDLAVEIGNIDYTIWVWDGKLRGNRGEWACWHEDLNGDGKVDLVRMNGDYQKPPQIVANLSGQREEVSLRLKNFWKIEPLGDPPLCFSDFDENKRRELLMLGESGYSVFLSVFLLRFWIEGDRWRWEQIPLGKGTVEFAGTMGVGNRNWLLFWNRDQGRLTALWWEKNGWKRKTWRFRITPWSTLHYVKVERDDKGWILVMTRIWSPERHPFWKKLERIKVFIPFFSNLLSTPMGERYREVWRWDEQKLSWRLEQPIHEDDRLRKQVVDGIFGYSWVIPLDLNKDGQEEKLIYEEHGGLWGYLAVKVGRLWKRWRVVPLWREQHFPIVILNQKGWETWIVGLDYTTRVSGVTGRILRAWTLEK